MLTAAGVAVWPMVEFEADDALGAPPPSPRPTTGSSGCGSARPDKDLGQCVGGKVVQLDRRKDMVSDARRRRGEVRRAARVHPRLPRRWSATPPTASPVCPGWGAKSAAAVLARYGQLEDIPPAADEWDVPVRSAGKLAATPPARASTTALLFRRIATIETDAPTIESVDELRWTGPKAGFAALCDTIDAPGLAARQDPRQETPPEPATKTFSTQYGTKTIAIASRTVFGRAIQLTPEHQVQLHRRDDLQLGERARVRVAVGTPAQEAAE